MSDAIQALRSHTPLSAFDRDIKRDMLHIDHENRIQGVAWVVGAAVCVLVLAAIALGSFAIVSWRSAGMAVGGGAFLLGLCRYGANALLHGWSMRQYKVHLPLSEADKQLLQTLVDQHPQLESELDIWNLQRDELSAHELMIVQKWCRRHKVGQR